MRQSSIACRIIMLVFGAILLTGCQTLTGPEMITSSATADLSEEAASAIAGDMVDRLAQEIGPGTNTIGLVPDGSRFGQSLETSLRNRGYAVVTDQATDDDDLVRLAYAVDDFEGSVLVRISTPRVELTRIYRQEGAGAAPASPISIMQRGLGAAS